MNRKAQHDITRKLKVLNHAKEIGNISKHVDILVYTEKHFTRENELMKDMEKKV